MENIENKISVEEYLKEKKLLKLNEYIPYTEKIHIVDAVIKQAVAISDGIYTLDSVILDRVLKQIIIERSTNLDLSILNIDGLDGYDLLLKNDEMNNILSDVIASEYVVYNDILKLRIHDFERNNMTIQKYMNTKINNIMNNLEYRIPIILDQIDNIDSKKLIGTISNILDSLINSK